MKLSLRTARTIQTSSTQGCSSAGIVSEFINHSSAQSNSTRQLVKTSRPKDSKEMYGSILVTN
jgi:hypothetical protein